MIGVSGSTTRRALLIGVAGAVTGAAGCLGTLRRAADRDAPERLNVEIMTLPEDGDIFALRIANHLASNLEEAGVQVDVIPTRLANFLRDVLINLDFDMYVWRHPGQVDPDFLRPLLHSRFAEESGWQNPFSYSNRLIDDLLEEQLVLDGDDRQAVLDDLQRGIAEENPFVPIAFEQEERVIRSNRLRPSDDVRLETPEWLLRLQPSDDSDPGEFSCALGTVDWRMTHNLNPIAVEYRGPMDVTDLIYEPLGRRQNGEFIPWLASRWEWVSPTGARSPTLEIELRQDVTWHDGEPVTAEDVEFTYEFLQDTSMTEGDPNIPAPIYRGRTTLVDTIEAIDDSVARLQFVRTTRSVATRLLGVPIIPQHVWSEHTGLTEVAGIPVSDMTTDALVIDNLNPIGSGPYQIESVDMDSVLRLVRLDDHYLFSDELAPVVDTILDAPPIRELTMDIRPSTGNIANSVGEGGLDGSFGSVGRALREVIETGVEEVTGIGEQTSRLYHVGFNLREAPFTNLGFRDVISRLIDYEFIVSDIFHEAARPSRSPLFEEGRVPSDLVWTDSHARRFVGEPGTGEVDREEAMDLFREVGFQYSEDGHLLSR